ncbi:GMC oxidoreductase [Ceratobasidium sp. AG-Ba]|nr:GMC oxidoreductase [Ceratobasidium sp. AG-Ba]
MPHLNRSGIDITTFAGCVVGGGTAINGLLYWYPPDIEYSTTNGWPTGWQSIGAYVNKLKARLPATETPSSDGKLYLIQVYDVVKSLLDKQGYSQYVINDSPNTKDHAYGRPGYYAQNGKRTGPMDTYLKTSKTRPNFKLLMHTKPNAHILTERHWIVNGNGIISLTTKGRVVVAAGVFGTAKILYQSGIGPADMLAITAGNPTTSNFMPPASQYINLPVGHFVRDSPGVNLVFTHPTVDDYDNWAPVWGNPRPADANQFVTTQSGVFAYASPRANFWRVYQGPDGISRHIQGTARPGSCCFTPTYPYNTTAQFTITVYIGTGLTSVGRIGIDSSLQGTILTKPWLTDPVEKTVLTNAIADLLSTYKQVPGLQLISPDNTTSIATHVTNMAAGSNHWTASTRIGTNSTTSVVDPNTKVWNTNNLFIVDAGIYPGAFVANPQGSLMVMAEIAAAKILALAGGA